MVNKAIQDLITFHHGEEAWERVRNQSGLEEMVFVSTMPYPDSITYRLVKEASDVLKLTQEEILTQFGRWWVVQTAQRGYGHLMKAAGRTLADFLVNLPNFHTRIVMMFPDLKPPEFECTDIRENSLRLHYHSPRPGLAPFVVGLLEGLGEMFSTTIEVSHEAKKDAGASHDIFRVSWPAAEKP